MGSFSTSYNPRVGVSDHKAQAPHAVGCFVLTVSDTRTADTDTSGRAIRELLEAAGHDVIGVRARPRRSRAGHGRSSRDSSPTRRRA